MVERAVATKLVLHALEQPEDISSLDNRKRLQKLIYLAQAAGVALGYGFSWYLRGPYSATLAKDYYNMPSVDLHAGDSPKLKPEVVALLEPVRGILAYPDRPSDLAIADWLELVASVHYLEQVSGLDTGATTAKLTREKPNLAGHVDAARTALATHFPQQETRQ